MGIQQKTCYTYADLEHFPEDNLRREIISGELFETASPTTRHQDVVLTLGVKLFAYKGEHGGKVYIAPTDVYFSDIDVVVPDVLFVSAQEIARVEKKLVRGAPTLVVEVSSPSTRKLELARKRELYRSFGVPEYWYVDLDADLVQVYRLVDDYLVAHIFGRADTLKSPVLAGFSITVEELLGPEEAEGS